MKGYDVRHDLAERKGRRKGEKKQWRPTLRSDTSWHNLLNAIFARHDLYNHRGGKKKKKETNRHPKCRESTPEQGRMKANKRSADVDPYQA